MKIDDAIRLTDLTDDLATFWELSGWKIRAIEQRYARTAGTPVFTRQGRYTSQGWTEWTQGFQYGSALLQYDATGGADFLEIGRGNTLERMPPHVAHFGVHDHGFNNVSTYGNLLRLHTEGKLAASDGERKLYELALQVSGAVQARRWTPLPDGGGFIYSFNGPHSLFVDTLRTCRSLIVSHLLGYSQYDENDVQYDLLHRALTHAATTAKYAVYYGEERDRFDLRGRVAHESVFNTNDGAYRCPNSQQGYSGFTTWTRGLAWAILGFAEFLEAIDPLPEETFPDRLPKSKCTELFTRAARATADFYLAHSFADGVPLWDTGAPAAHSFGDYRAAPSDFRNGREPLDSSAAAITAQGFLRLAHYLAGRDAATSRKLRAAGLQLARTLIRTPYLSERAEHEGLLLHSVYHWPNGWDYVPEGSTIPYGEACMWGDYHIREVALYLTKELRGEAYLSSLNVAPTR